MNYEKHESAPAYMAGHSSATDYYMRQQVAQQEAEFEVYERFKNACEDMPATTVIHWSPLRTDWAAPHSPGTDRPQRHYQLHEVMSDALDFPRGPSMADAMQIILNAQTSSDKEIARQAKALIHAMAKAWADYNTPDVDE